MMDDKDQIITRPVGQGGDGFVDGLRIFGMLAAVVVTAIFIVTGLLSGAGLLAFILPIGLLIFVTPLILGNGPQG